jgi:hypothetical protein
LYNFPCEKGYYRVLSGARYGGDAELLNQYFSVVEFRKIRNLLIPKTREAKIFSEDDVHKLIS